MGRMSDMALEVAESAQDDSGFYASLVEDRRMAFSYRNALETAWPPTKRTKTQQAEIEYARSICDIARDHRE